MAIYKNIFIPLWILMWKYVKIRCCRYCDTFWETFGGVSVFILLFLVHHINLIKLHPEFVGPETRRMSASNDSLIRVFYSPLNNFTQSLMTMAAAHLDQDISILPKYRWDFESIVFPIKLHADFFKTSAGLAEVEFKNSESLPTALEYSLYAVSDEATNKLNGLFNGVLRTITPKEEIVRPYLAQLQWAIDRSFIERLTNQSIQQAIMMSSTPNFIKGELLTLHRFMVLCTILGPLPFFIAYSTRLIVERRTAMKELMKHSGIYPNVLLISHVMEAVVIGTLYSTAVTLLLKTSSQPLLPESNPFIIGFTIVWHFVNTMCLAIFTTALSQDFQHADSLGLFLYMSTFILDFLWYSYKKYTYVLACVLPHAPVYLFWDEVLQLERVGVGTQISNIYKAHSDYSVLRVWTFFGIQLAVTMVFSWYLVLTRPGYYGVPKTWDFFAKARYWHPKVQRKVIQLPTSLFKRDEIHFEKKPRNAEIAVQVLNVSMVFKQHGTRVTQVFALDSVTFDCYKGEVTMLLGGNGAGKTTLMLIVAGMLRATEGTVFLEGVDVANRDMEIHHNVGICMQKNVCFENLTVKENIMFFKKLQERSKTEGFSVQKLLKSLKLAKLADHYGSQLTAGKMRCLQVACVLANDANVLVLDEPTTGMDLEARDHLWDLLMLLRGNKTILMTTTCLEEANALGDRIAILDKGVLKCHGSPTFLKNIIALSELMHFDMSNLTGLILMTLTWLEEANALGDKNIIGTSFILSITIKEAARLYDLKETIDRIIPGLDCRIKEMRRVDYLLPTKEFQMFPTLFEVLEDKKQELGIIVVDVAMFMEEVFQRFIETQEIEQYSNVGIRHRSKIRNKHLVGCKLIFKQMYLLIRRVFTYLIKTKGYFFALRIVIPIICLIIITVTSNYSLRRNKMFSHQIHKTSSGDTRLVYNVAPSRRSGLSNVVDRYPDVKPVYTLDIDKEFRRLSKGYFNKDTVGLKITDNYTRIYHSLDPRATSKSINIFSNVYMSMLVPHLNNTIRTSYESLPKPQAGIFREVKSKFLCVKFTSWLTFLSIIPLTPIILLCIVERNCGIRDNHMMAGCTPKVHWGARLLAHMIVFVIIILIPIIFIAWALDYDNTFIHSNFIFAVAVLLFAFGLAFHASLYFLSFILSENVAIGEIYIASLMFGVILPIFLSILELVWHNSLYYGVPYVILVVVGRISPQFALGVGLARLTLTARLNAFCTLNRQLCPDLEFDDEAFDAAVCCQSDKSNPFPYFVSYESGLFDLLYLILQFFVFATLVILLEYRIPQYMYEMFSFAGYKEPAQAFNVKTVKDEATYVRTAIQNKSYKDNVLLVQNVHKDYKTRKLLRKKKSFGLVRGVSYATKLGECLAIIGPQAAGKTLLMNMLAGNTTMTRGDACINGIYLRRNRMKYIHKISLSSSTGGLDKFMTGAQNLVFIAKLKGYPEQLAMLFAYKALKCMGLLTTDPLVSNYSSGCLRRLSLCSSLVLGPTVAFLDEPMKEVDASSKPLVANALRQLKGLPAAVIVAESTVDWSLLEPVFNRIAIMSKGQFANIGPTQEILGKIARGYSARIKLRMVTAYRTDRYLGDDEESSESETDLGTSTSILESTRVAHSDKSVMFATTLNDFKRDFLKAFSTSRLCREHLCMLFFIIEDEYLMERYSDMFRKLQELKEKYNDLIEDYYLSSVTVEDVFYRLQYERHKPEEGRNSSTATLKGFEIK